MGGNAIKPSIRIDKNKFDQYFNEIKNLLPNLKMAVVKSYFSKVDFGDIDIVVQKQHLVDIKKYIIDTLQPTELYDNNMFLSVLYKDAQVDFILTNEREFESTCNYMHFNDISNFIGRTARALNFKYGHDGLSYEKHFSDHYKITVHVSTDMAKILAFLGYDYERWTRGFNTEEEIFEFAASSEFFNPLYFTLENQSNNDRVRNKKRIMYQKMLKYIETHNLKTKPKFSSEQRDYFLYNVAPDYFGYAFINEINQKKDEYQKYIKYKTYFNGDIVKDITGLEGKDLGMFMQHLKTSIDNDVRSIIDSDIDQKQEKINNLIKNCYLNYCKR